MERKIGERDFDIKTIKGLSKKGIKIVGITTIPGDDNSWSNSETGYIIHDNGTQRIKGYMDIVKLGKE